MICSKFTELVSHHDSPVLEHFHHLKDCSQSLFPLTTQETTNVFVLMVLPIMDIFYKWNHIICVLL